jgi:F-type H+-transporting ATPase subunit b
MMLSRIAANHALKSLSVRLMSSAASGSETEVAAAKKHEVKLLGKDNPDSVFYIGPERDLVNFPRRKRPIEAPPVRFGFLPDEWFTMFHAKTGVTGPYMFLTSVGTFLISKEFYVLEHEFYTGVGLILVCAGIVKVAGPGFKEWIVGEMAKDETQLKAIRQVFT